MAPHLMRAQGGYKADKHATPTHEHTHKHPHTPTRTHTLKCKAQPVQYHAKCENPQPPRGQHDSFFAIDGQMKILII